MSGPGELIPNHAGIILNINGSSVDVYIPPGFGGGCVTNGPFIDYTVNVGHLAMSPVGPEEGLGYNPRCLKRDIGPGLSYSVNYTAVLSKPPSLLRGL